MAGRPLGLRSLVRALAKLSPAQVKQLLASAPATRSNGKLERLERQREKHVAAIKKLDRQIAELSGGNGSVAAAPRRGRKPGRKKGYTLSAATRRKMSEAAKRRYAGGAKSEAPASTRKRTRKPFSAETRAKMAAAQQARWARVNAVGSGASRS